MKYQVFQRSACHAVLPVHPVMAQLVDQRIRLIGDPLPVSIHIDAGEGCDFDGVFTHLPHPVQDGIRRVKRGRCFVEGIEYRFTGELLQVDPCGVILQLTIAKRGDFTRILRHRDGLRAGIALVRGDGHDIGIPSGQQCQIVNRIADGTPGTPVKPPLFHRLAQVDFHGIAASFPIEGDPDPAKCRLSEIRKMGRGIHPPDFHRRFILFLKRTDGCGKCAGFRGGAESHDV